MTSKPETIEGMDPWQLNAELREAVVSAEEALGENLVWLADKLDILIRQKDGETLRRLDQLNTAWKALCVAKARGE